ncbi:MAG: hypothetical protein AAF721_28310 [Myxococcota bacterium]
MRAATKQLKAALLLMLASCVPPPAATAPPNEGPPQTAGGELFYNDIADAIGIREGIEGGLLRDGEALVFVATDPQTGAPLPDARLVVGDGPDAQVISADDQGRIRFPVSLALVDANPRLRKESASVDEPSLGFSGTISFGCDERGVTSGAAPRRFATEDYAALSSTDFGPDRVYAFDGAVVEADVRAMGEQLARVRAAFRTVTGWTPPPLAVLLVGEASERLAPEVDADGRTVWLLATRDIGDRHRSTAFIAHEWTHAALHAHAPASGAGQPEVRWLEDGLCELVAYEVERELYPDLQPTTLQSRAAELAAPNPEIPDRVDLLGFGLTADRGLFAVLVAQCDGGRVYGYAYAFAFWRATKLSAGALRTLLAKLESTSLPDAARSVAPATLTELSLSRTEAQHILADQGP